MVTIPLVKRVSIPETLELIPHGKTARYAIKQMNPQSVRAYVSRANKRAGRKEYEVKAYENGAFFDVTRF